MTESRPTVQVRVTFLNGGYCRQLLRLVEGKTWRFSSFHAVFLAIEHPTRGLFLVDTGYSTRFHECTQRWPRRLYRWMTPVHAGENPRLTLRRAGLAASDVQAIIVTHFHADHVGGLLDFPDVPLVFSEGALKPLQARSAWSQTINAFLPGLVPADISTRARGIPRRSMSKNASLGGLPTQDVFGDGSIHVVALPGHAPGHLGVYLETREGRLLYAADAYWHFRQIQDDIEPALPARIFIDDRAAYRSTVETLRALAHASDLRILACHCPQTQNHVFGGSRA